MAPVPDRISKISLGKYDQVVSVTQEMINAGLEGQFLITKARAKKDKKDLHFNLSVRSGESIQQGLFDVPQVIIGTAPNSYSTVVYVMYFEEGTVNLYSDDKVEEPDIHDSMNGWYFAFSVDLGLSKLQDPQKEEELRKLINIPGNYTLKQLALDLNTASIVNFNQAFTCEDINNLPAAAKEGFSSLMRKALDSVSLTSLGYGTEWDKNQPKSSSIPPPTFLPSFQAFQTYPWIDTSNPKYEAHSSLFGNDRLNYLCYKEMTNNHDPPPRQDATLLPSGNWTDGTAPEGESVPRKSLGTFAMTKAQFLEGWFLPKLRLFNKVMEPSLRDLVTACDSDDVLWFTIKWGATLGVSYNSKFPNLNDSHFDWVAQKVPDDPTKPREYKFSSEYQLGSQKKWIGWEWAPLVTFWGDGDCSVTNTVTYTPGSDLITLRGSSRVHLYASLKNLTTDDDSITYSSNWSIDFHLESVSDGGLQITMPLPDEPSGSWTEDKNEIGLFNSGDTPSTNWKKYIEERHRVAFKNFSEVKARLVDDLAGAQKFVLPAGGTFFHLDPVLNHDGALLCNIYYNGNESEAGNPDPRAPTRQVVKIQPPPPFVSPPTESERKTKVEDEVAAREYWKSLQQTDKA